MVTGKCRNLLFNAIFFMLFFVGCLIGAVLFQCASDANLEWISRYGSALLCSQYGLVKGFFFSFCRVMLILFLAALLPWGDRAFPIFLVLRGVLSTYFISTCYISSVFHFGYLLYNSSILLICYLVGRWLYFRNPAYTGSLK